MGNSNRNVDPLAMRIYTALLGSSPRVAKTLEKRPRMSLRIRLTTEIITESISPFRVPSLKQNLGRAAADAVSALSEAGERLRQSRAKVRRADAPPVEPGAKPIVLIGSMRRAIKPAENRSAA